MSRQWYGSIDNRLEENRMFCETIEVGTGMTEYSWSDRHAYEVIAVRDQKHVTVREYDHKHVGEPYTNQWELISNPENPARDLTKRGKYWYWTTTVTSDVLDNCKNKDEELNLYIWLINNHIDRDELIAKGKVTKHRRANVSFGIADYYYDYEF